MTPQCPECGKDVLDIDVKCPHCGAGLAGTGAHKMLGQVMLGQYELVDVLGQGGMSVVFKGKHKMTDQEVALKILPPELAAHSQVKSRFLDEAKALAALDHANIVHLYNFGAEAGYFVLAMQFVQGQTWERMILEAKRLDWKTSARITCDVLRALEYAHGRGVVHRDMKPSNVLVKEQDGSATVMDFGIAKMTTSTRLTATGQTMGTVRYMSPEQVRGQEVDFRTDIYSLGATLYESITGDTPFDGTTHFEIMTKHLSEPPKRPTSLGIEVPMSVEDALIKSLAKKAEDRFDSARAMRKILEAALRAADPGLVDTQRVSGDELAEIRSSVSKPGIAPPPASSVDIGPATRRVATASDLADQLEPGLQRTQKSKLPWIALAMLVLAGGAVTAFLIFRTKESPGPAKPPPAGAPFPTLAVSSTSAGNVKILVESTTKIDATAVATAYRKKIDQLQEAAGTLVDPLGEIYVIPQARLCTASAYLDGKLPTTINCKDSSYAVPLIERRLYVVAEHWSDGLADGTLDAACLYEADPKLQKVLCDLATKKQGDQPQGEPGSGTKKRSK